MHITVLIPHYRTKKMTTYSVAQFIKNKGRHKVDIIVIDNSYPDDSIKCLDLFKDEVTIISNAITDKIQSHGIAFEMAMPHVKTEYFVTAESDSFPTNDKWLDYYEQLINNGATWGGSILKLSGGQFVHPTGAFYLKKHWEDAKEYCNNVEYSYFNNMSRYNDFDCHLMVHNRILEEFLAEPSKYVDLVYDYKELSKEQIIQRLNFYKPMVSPFHNGMGILQESYHTYGQRSISSEVPNILLDNKENFIHRIGYEPGQWFAYWLIATGRKGSPIPTEIKWMRNRGFQQQEYTLTESGVKHLWGISAYHEANGENVKDIIDFKKNQVDKLYDSLPNELKQ